ncbi:hypothetical protein B6U84_06250 [Candidatus Bathyarchaeota archaeon ex4484_40]|nr:MAG: hypothetical protein B6U84_06250 [Candidatus Bathyarchaeota archaeon ex4484_40]
MIEGAIVSCVSEGKPLKPVPKLATTVEEIIECAGTRYVYSPNPLAFREALARRVRSLAFVGTPCQIRALDGDYPAEEIRLSPKTLDRPLL